MRRVQNIEGISVLWGKLDPQCELSYSRIMKVTRSFKLTEFQLENTSANVEMWQSNVKPWWCLISSGNFTFPWHSGRKKSLKKYNVDASVNHLIIFYCIKDIIYMQIAVVDLVYCFHCNLARGTFPKDPGWCNLLPRTLFPLCPSLLAASPALQDLSLFSYAWIQEQRVPGHPWIEGTCLTKSP